MDTCIPSVFQYPPDPLARKPTADLTELNAPSEQIINAEQKKIDQNNYIHFYDVKTNETIVGYTVEDYIRDNDNKSDDETIQVLSDQNECGVFCKLQGSDELSLNLQNNTLSKNNNNNKIIYSKNLFLNFKNNFFNIINVVELNNYELSSFRKIFKIKNKYITNPAKIYYEDGTVYKGEITKKYERHGFGTMYYQSGDIFSINWNKNNAHGFGTYKYYDSTKLVGKWINNMFHGNNSIYYSNGDTYKGTTKYNMLSGYGIMYYYDGSTYEGYWHNNMHCIGGIITYPNGETYQYAIYLS